MGRAYLFECARCSYRVAVAGGVDRGAHCFVQTIHCRDCRILVDVPIRVRVADHEIQQPYRLWPRNMLAFPRAVEPSPHLLWQNRLAFGGSFKWKWVNVALRCPVSRFHRVETWQEPGRCPRCGTYLDRALTPSRVWD